MNTKTDHHTHDLDALIAAFEAQKKFVEDTLAVLRELKEARLNNEHLRRFAAQVLERQLTAKEENQ